MKMFKFLYLLFLLQTSQSRCPDLCDCPQRAVVNVKCRERDLDDIPQDLPCKIGLLDLRRNFITALEKESFSCQTELAVLLLSNNHLCFIEKEVFDDAEDLIETSSHETWTNPNEKELEQALVLGSRRHLPGFLTIGIPTVQRETAHYLTQTIDSLIDKSSPKERSDVIILIFLADFEEEKRSKLKVLIKRKILFSSRSWIHPSYPGPDVVLSFLENLKSNYGDSKTRVYWRSKQCVVDFAFMFFYGSSLSEYYLQIEDDVYTVNGYLAAVRDFIKDKSNVQWASLEFSTLGFIGKLFHAYDLDRLATLILVFYQDMPVDWIFLHFKDLNAQQKNHVRRPSIFQHRGFNSSLKEKSMKNVIDRTFVDDKD
nr:alpha-1,3-mannosyl-glycoprotein 4-beta-N-acetylglucosaminyltransferase C-like [Lytechinus pictus]